MLDKVIETTFTALEKDNYASVTDFCRYLVSTGGKFEGIKIHVYREEMLCLIVNDIYKAAEMQSSDSGWTKYDKRRLKASVEPRTAFIPSVGYLTSINDTKLTRELPCEL